MKLYLVQHGEAKSKEEDPERSLTEKGIRETEIVSEFLKGKVKVLKIVHSGKKRAFKTAQILAEKLGITSIEVSSDLEPLSDPYIWKQRLENTSEDLMIVGHLPHLEKLVSLLLTGDESLRVLSFKNSGVVCLEKKEGGWTLRWIVIPEILR